jgi:hypothetical protein
MKELSTEKIEIGGVEYTLFLNRKGIVAFEKASSLAKTFTQLTNKYKDEETFEFDGNVDPFETYGGELEELEKQEKEAEKIYIKFYWIALYENHKLNYEQVEPLFEQAKAEYGMDQLVELANQMIEDVNTEKGTTELKKLTALRPKKK